MDIKKIVCRKSLTSLMSQEPLQFRGDLGPSSFVQGGACYQGTQHQHVVGNSIDVLDEVQSNSSFPLEFCTDEEGIAAD
jgi:hypothetical protein